MATHSEHSQVDQVSHICEVKLDNFKNNHERMPYFEEESTLEGKEGVRKGYYPKDGFDGKGI